MTQAWNFHNFILTALFFFLDTLRYFEVIEVTFTFVVLAFSSENLVDIHCEDYVDDYWVLKIRRNDAAGNIELNI